MNICIYGASGNELAQEYFDDAFALGQRMAENGHTLVFGGGNGGLMGACARGAASKSGEIIGIAPRFFDEPGVLFPACSRFVYTETMRERKAAMEAESGAFIVLPGGIGTFEEFFEILTLKQLGRHAKPIAVLNTLGYYGDLLRMLETAVSGGFLSRSCLALFALCDTPEEALQHVLTAPVVTGSVRRIADYTKK